MRLKHHRFICRIYFIKSFLKEISMRKIIFKGAAVALVTPFNADGKINYKKVEELIEFQIANGTNAIVVSGTTGESATLSLREKIELTAFAAKVIHHRVPLIAGAGSNCTQSAAEICSQQEKAGADALLIVTPYYNKCTPKGLFLHYKACAEKTELPIIVYNVPSRTGVNIYPETYEKLLEIKNICAVKEASGNAEQAARIISLYSDAISVYCGNDDLTQVLLSCGAAGVISVLSNLCPKTMHDICEANLQGETERGAEIFDKYARLIAAMSLEVNPIPVKTAMNLAGMNVGGFRLPLCEAENFTKERIARELAAIKN